MHRSRTRASRSCSRAERPASTLAWAFLLLTSPGLLAGCEGASAELSLGMSLGSLDYAGLPPEVQALRVEYRVGAAAPVVRTAQLSELDTAEGRRSLTLEPLPADALLTVRVEGQLADGSTGYVGSLGPLSLAPGEHLQQRIVLASTRRSEALTETPLAARFLHTTTALGDGRVLISGGFGAPEPSACPLGTPAEARCFRVVALADAWLFDASSLRFFPVAGGLLAPRGGHAATALPDGRVLIAGGASEALLLLDATGPGAYLPRFLALDAARAPTIHASFELFERAPVGSNPRDPARGLFVGSASAGDQPGPLLEPRFLHAQAENPSDPGQVLLAGGVGSLSAAHSHELFELSRPGGYGVSALSLAQLLGERSTPFALGLRSGAAAWVWIFGGNHALDNDQLAERWTPSAADPKGSLAFATESAFPESDPLMPSIPHPEYAFPRALGARFGGLERALVAAAYPMYCGDSPTPLFPPTSLVTPSEGCTDANVLRQCMILEAGTGLTHGCQLSRAHLLGASAELDEGSVLLSGGLADVAGATNLELQRLSLAPASTAELSVLSDLTLASPRALHTSTGLPAGGALSVGGLEFTGPTQPVLVELVAEIVRW